MWPGVITHSRFVARAGRRPGPITERVPVRPTVDCQLNSRLVADTVVLPQLAPADLLYLADDDFRHPSATPQPHCVAIDGVVVIDVISMLMDVRAQWPGPRSASGPGADGTVAGRIMAAGPLGMSIRSTSVNPNRS
jgi:hypothetical protein